MAAPSPPSKAPRGRSHDHERARFAKRYRTHVLGLRQRVCTSEGTPMGFRERCIGRSRSNERSCGTSFAKEAYRGAFALPADVAVAQVFDYAERGVTAPPSVRCAVRNAA